MSLLTVVEVGNVGLVLSRTPLVSLNRVYIYRSLVRSVHRTTIGSFLLVISLSKGYSLDLTLSLIYILTVVNIDSYSNIVIKYLRPVSPI